MSNMFDDFMAPAPTGGDKLDLHALNGSLLIFSVTEDIDHVQTSVTQPGEKSPAIRADIFVVDGSKAGATLKDALVFPKMLQAQLRPAVGSKVLGRLGRGVAAPGKSAPWELAQATDADKAAASRAWAARGTAAPAPAPSRAPAEAPF